MWHISYYARHVPGGVHYRLYQRFGELIVHFYTLVITFMMMIIIVFDQIGSLSFIQTFYKRIILS